MKNRITLIACPRGEAEELYGKLLAIISNNAIAGVELLRMEVSCCGVIEALVKRALSDSGKNIPISIITISTDGKILDE